MYASFLNLKWIKLKIKQIINRTYLEDRFYSLISNLGSFFEPIHLFDKGETKYTKFIFIVCIARLILSPFLASVCGFYSPRCLVSPCPCAYCKYQKFLSVFFCFSLFIIVLLGSLDRS